jgi:hypothetical protein
VLRLPLAPVDAGASNGEDGPCKRARTLAGYGVLRAAEMRAELAAKDAAKENAAAAKAKTRADQAATSGTGRARGRPPKSAAVAPAALASTSPVPALPR